LKQLILKGLLKLTFEIIARYPKFIENYTCQCFDKKMLLLCSKTLNEFRKGQFQVLVSSDAMTRGMDVEGVRNVINYDMPKYIKTYVHRAGRTARAGQTGCCFTLMSNDEV